jgi:DNA/RNA endonuclease G (NUC1)
MRRQFLALALAAFLLLPNFIFNTPLIIQTVHADTTPTVSITALGAAVTQNFNTLVSSGTGTLAANTPTGWGFAESLSNANTTYTAGTGSGVTGDTYSFGSATAPGSSDRALGQLRSANLASIIGASFTNNTGGVITSLAVSYAGEQWRLGATGRTIAERMDFQYSTSATSLTTGAYTDVDALDFSPPVTSGTVGALDGNAAANRAVRSSTITGLSIPAGATFWIRWTDIDATGSDDGLAIDDFSLTANGAISQPALSISDVSQTEGNSGVTNFQFNVSLNSPAGASGVAFNASTADGATNPATTADNDYAPLANQSFTIPQGNSSTTVTVQVNGDAKFEPNETFFVNISGVTGATVSDGQGQGTIVNDDLAPTTPSGAGSATPASLQAGGGSLLTVAVTPGANPTSAALTVTADLSSIGGSNAQQFFDDGTHGDATANDLTFSFGATVAAGAPTGAKTLPVTIADNYLRTANTTISLSVVDPPAPAGSVVISQIYGGGGNSGATLRRDFIEIFNRSPNTVSLAGLSVQYSSANGSSWAATPITGTLAPGQYFLIEEAQGAGGSADLPTPNVPGGAINLSASNGKVALVRNNVALTGACPTGNSNVMDFVGYGAVNCSEGDDATPGDSAAPALSSASAAIRLGDGCTDTDSNAADFSAGAPVPRNSASPINSCDVPPPPVGDVNSTVVISQVYAGGGNSGATYLNDYVELYNRGASTVNLAGWSLQYASSAGSGWDSNKQPLGGTMAPGEYYLVSLASGGATGQTLPPANVVGEINMSATAGKIALVKNFDGLEGTCPLSDPDLADFVGYGSAASCGEGNKKAPSPGTANAILRKSGGGIDTDNNQADFLAGSPNPRRSAPIVEIGPAVFGSDPRSNATTAPRDASITVNFTEPVDLTGAWFNLNCTTTGLHNDAAVSGGPKTYLIIPNTSFVNGEQCSVTIFKDSVHDQDLNDAGPNDDTLSADYTWTFATSTGAAPPYTPDVHLTMGNPSGATADVGNPNNYLMQKPEFALSYSRDRGTPNWVSWHLSDEWTGSLTRVDSFRPDPAVPSEWYRVLATDYSGSGFDRGHMTPNADRDKETSIPINQATFLMSNMVPQAPDNNQGPWAAFEGYLRTLLPANEIYIVSGPAGVGGTGSNGFATTIAGGHATVPASTWKVALVLPKGDGDLSRVTAATRTIAVVMPNTQGIRNNDWSQYLTTVDAVESLTGYDFFSNVPDAVENSIEAGRDGSNPPGTEGQFVSVAEDTPTPIALTAVSPNNNPLTYTVTQPSHGALTGTGADRTYTPAPEYKGPDSFTFSVNDGSRNSNTSTVTINVTEVNDAPFTADDSKTTQEDTALSFPASELTANDGAGAPDEAGQTLTVTSVTHGADTHGAVSLDAGQVAYTPDLNYNGAASFTYQVCDDGATSGSPDSKCATATVTVTVLPVNDAPTTGDDDAAVAEDSVENVIDVLTGVGADTDIDGDTLTVMAVGAASHGVAGLSSGVVKYTPAADYNGSDSFTYTVSDGNGGSATGTVNVSVTAVNDTPAAAADVTTTDEDAAATVNVLANDSDIDGDGLSVTAVTQGAHGAVTNQGGSVTYTPAPNFNGADTFTYTVSDSHGGSASATVTVTVAPVNDAPVAVADSASTDEDTPVVIDVRANDADVDGDALSLTGAAGASKGTVAVTADGKARYTPNPNENGPDSFTYTVSDGKGGTATAAVSVSINPVNDAPVLSNVPASATLSELAPYTFTAQASDVDGQALTFSLVGAPTGASISQSGVFIWTPTEAQGGAGSPYQFKVRVSDGDANVDADISFTVKEVNQAPTLAQIGDKMVLLGGALSFTAVGADADLPAQTLSYSLTGSVPSGASINPTTGDFNWMPSAAQAGRVYSFGVRVTDNGAGSLFAEEGVGVGVGYTWSGLLQPVNQDGSSVFNLGRTIPIKFQLTGASAGVTNAVARLYLAKVTDSIIGTEEKAGSTSSATEGNLFRYSGGQYIFNLSTDGLTKGTYQLRVDTGDGVLRAVNISLR